MRQYVNGTKEQFEILEQQLADGMCHVFYNRELPACCSVQRARMGFEKNGNVYILYIDKGITTTSENQDFVRFLANGEARFICMEDMVSFLHSLRGMFSEQVQNHTVTTTEPTPVRVNPESKTPVIDMEKLKKIREEEEKEVMVWPEEIADRIKENIYGQDRAIEALAKKIVSNKLRKENKLLTVALLGPTATGKSETAKSLAKVMSELYKKPYGVIEVAGSEFIAEHSISSFFGAPPGYVGHGQPTKLDPVRQNPYHVIVIDEVEKANLTFLTGLMEAIDTGMLGMADNSPSINLNNCVMLFTSNIPIDMEKYNSLSIFKQNEMCSDAFTRHCGRPEISGKIGNFIVFNALDAEARTKIIIKFVREGLKSYDMTLERIDENLMNDMLKNETKYGARGIANMIVTMLGNQLLENRMWAEFKGKNVILKGSSEELEFIAA